jgi:RsiW-degrading membrane proteinase PrsW (M82 family)
MDRGRVPSRHFLLLLAFVPFAVLVVLMPQRQENAGIARIGARDDGALLAADSNVHWVFAAISFTIFFAAGHSLFERKRAAARGMLASAAFTATLGITLLLTVQRIASDSIHETWYGNGYTVLLNYVFRGIAFSYRAVHDDGGPLELQVIGYIFGVGLCEEITKLLPVLFAISRRPGYSATDARVIGFMSGIGFGVAEGILYSQRDYNGSAPAIAYAVRFLSVVAMHGLATATAGGLVVRHQLEEELGRKYFVKLVWVIFPVIVLHAVYDTFCSRGLLAWALAVELTLFGMLAYQIGSEASTGETAHAQT